MKFSIGSQFHLESDCNSYMICKVTLEGRSSYSAWYRDICLGQRNNSTDAKRLCADHARRVQATALPA